MIFLISLILAIIFELLCGKALRARPEPFYIGAVVTALAVIIISWSGIQLPEIISNYVFPIFARGGLAGSLFVIVMFTGAFPNGSKPIKKLMPIRGQLSIIACILTLGHNIAYGKIYFAQLFTALLEMPANRLAAAICSVLMIIIMLPLFVTSFQFIRKKMRPKTWKKLQRTAYVFYALLFAHIMLLTIPNALNGDVMYKLTVFVYGAAFLSYFVCRISKAISKKRKSTDKLPRYQTASAVCCLIIAGTSVLFMRTGSVNGTALQTDTVSLPEEIVESIDVPEGVFSGSAMGMNAPITVNVTVENGKIAGVEIISARDDEPYFTDALAVIDDIIAANGTQVDTVSGATYSSGGIIDAVKAALDNAK